MTLQDELRTLKQDYDESSLNAYMVYADVFIEWVTARLKQLVTIGDVTTSYTVSVFDYDIPESRVFTDREKIACPQEFYDHITEHFDAENVTTEIVPDGCKITFSWE